MSAYPGTNTIVMSKETVLEVIRTHAKENLIPGWAEMRITRVEPVDSYGHRTGEFKIEFTTDPEPAPVPSTLPEVDPVVESAS